MILPLNSTNWMILPASERPDRGSNILEPQVLYLLIFLEGNFWIQIERVGENFGEVFQLDGEQRTSTVAGTDSEAVCAALRDQPQYTACNSASLKF